MKIWILLALVAVIATASALPSKIRLIETEELLKSESAAAGCPNACSGHGVCSGTTCTCNTGWAGVDCSIADITVSNGVPVTNQNVAARAWIYYNIQIQSGQGLTWVVNSTSSGDCDLYLKKNGYPTTTSYDQRDISTSANVALAVTNPSAGLYRLGVYGFSACSFTVTATVTNSCPNSCSGHGTCNNGVCTCNSNYYGNDCHIYVAPLTADNQISGTVSTGAWQYYSIQFTGQLNNMDIILNQTSTPCDIDLYVKLGALPTIFNYDYADTGTKPNFDLSINEPQAGTWFFGIYGFQGCGFLLEVSFYFDCPNGCSGPSHGRCFGGSCVCNSGFSGPYCQTMTSPLTLGSPVNGYVGDNSWNYYNVIAGSQDALVIVVNQTEETSGGDCDLYVRANANPTLSQFAYRNIGYLPDFSVTIPNPLNTHWYIGVYGFESCGYILTAMLQSSCPGCNTNNGQCIDGECVCNNNWAGENCTVPVTELASGTAVSGGVYLNTWQYYTLDIVGNTSAVAISLRETYAEDGPGGFVWVYMDIEGFPDLQNYYAKDTETNTPYHSVVTEFDPPYSGTIFIGVYGDPFISTTNQVTYNLVAWASPF